MDQSKDLRRGAKPLRVWPGVVLVALQWTAWWLVPRLWPDALVVGFMGGFAGGLGVLVWWVFFSRAPLAEKLLGVALLLAVPVGMRFLLHESIATGAMGMLYPMYVVPILSLGFVLWAVLARGLDSGARRATMAMAIVAACGTLALIRTGGVTGGFEWDLAWRWEKTPEERLLAVAGDVPAPVPAALASAESAVWPGFRGPRRDGVVRGVRIATDWSTSPPVELWRRPVGPGWSSFAVTGDLAYTQEQRGEEELVSAYALATGEPVWRHRDPVRFWEAMAGAGPRGTPTVAGDRVYALGATGLLNALDAATGAVVWSRDAAADTEMALPGWGFASSPLLVDDMVIVAVAGRLAAYAAADGELRWLGEAYGESYASPHLATLGGARQVLLQTGKGVAAVEPVNGEPLWEHTWSGFHSLQPAVGSNGDLFVTSSSSSAGLGVRRLVVDGGSGGWTVEEGWTSRGLKPYFNDFVVHEGHAYGFDGRILSAIELAGGERVWKGGRYGHGQLILLADQDLLLVLSESGELALVEAVPDGFSELAVMAAIEGKTWNHPVLAGDVLLVRNGQEMAAFRLPGA